MITLRRRLLIILLGSFAVTWLLLGGMSYRSARHEIEELFDAQLAQSARVLLGLTLHELQEEEEAEEPGVEVLPGMPGNPYEEKLAFQIWKGEELLMRSPNAPFEPMAQAAGYADRTIGDDVWRVFVLHEPQLGVRIVVGENQAVRAELVYDILLNSLLPILLALPLLAGLIWGGVARGLAPLRRVAGEIARRSPTQLQAIAVHDVPEEIRPLAESLNSLLARLDEALESERRFTANAAHELRTPLAGLRAQAQVALRAANDTERSQALSQIVRGVDRATRLVEQLLTLARLDPQTAGARHAPIDLADTVSRNVAELAPLALAKGIEIELAEASRGVVSGDPDMLAILLRNLVDNAIRYTPSGGHVRVSVTELDQAVTLAVTDSGPGIPESERQRVFERFYRLTTADSAGCGLGLSIVGRIVELHGARIRLDRADGGGLLVEVTFPPPPQNPAVIRRT